MTIRVKMNPSLKHFDKSESGIKRVIEAYYKHLPKFGIEIVDSGEDLLAVHAGTSKGGDIAHLHGLYWTNDYPAASWEFEANGNIIRELRQAKIITVPSPWVAETIQRDMRINPYVLTHGIDYKLWNPVKDHGGYVLWNKNRSADVCDPLPMSELAKKYPQVQFLTTFRGDNTGGLQNIRVTGTVAHDTMKSYVENSMVYLSTTKETFGIGILEAMASGVPVLGFDWGGNSLLVEHGVTGYLAAPNDIEDLAEGLDYCMKYRETIGENARVASKKWTWESAVERVADVYKIGMEERPYEHEVSVIIPCYNYAGSLERAVVSAVNQTRSVLEIIIVDDGSTDNTEIVGRGLADKYDTVIYIKKENGGVATARNHGIAMAKGEYIVCLDADDQIAGQFVEACITPLIHDREIGITYTGLLTVHPNGSSELSQWPGEFDADLQVRPRSSTNLRGMNQIPTCCMFRRDGWVRTGGFKQRYAPLGAGAEDAEFWARLINIGFDAKKVTDAGLFVYSFRTGAVSSSDIKDPALREPYWLSGHPSSMDRDFPLASVASPKNGKSHLVRQYDEPIISVIIPVGTGHERNIVDALDSLEGQSYRHWEAVVGWDSENELPEDIKLAYPYIRMSKTEKHSSGAGAARNAAVKHSRGSFLLFLDADDTIAPSFMEHTLNEWENQESIIYTDYYNKFTVSKKEELESFGRDLAFHNPKTNEVLVRGRTADYDCERAQNRPYDNIYHWCLVTCLVPKQWHNDIGGFDESMKTFEDVLYHWQMARRGHCYSRIEEPLVSYRMETGSRRLIADINTEEGKRNAQDMLAYCAETLEKDDNMASCKKCGPGRARPSLNVVEDMVAAITADGERMLDEGFVMVEYTSPNRGNHRVTGMGTNTNYGYRAGGNGTKFLVDKRDQELQPHLFKIVGGVRTAPTVSREELRPPQPFSTRLEVERTRSVATPKVEPIPTVGMGIPPMEDLLESAQEGFERKITAMDAEIDMSLLPGVTPAIKQELKSLGVTTKAHILELGVVGLVKIQGIGATKAEMLMEVVQVDADELRTEKK